MDFCKPKRHWQDLTDSAKPKLLITGGSGLLALNWAAEMSGTWNVELVLHSRVIAPGFAKTTSFNLLDPEECQEALRQLKPDLVVHTAGITSVEACENNPELAEQINVGASRNMALACAIETVRFVSISTDHLFGDDVLFATETTPVTPLNTYARTKAAGERAVVEANPQALVARTNFYCWGPQYRKSFAESIVTSLRKGETVSLFEDVFYTPIYTADLVRIVHELKNADAAGTFNICGPERLSKLEFGYKVAAAFGLRADLICASRLASREDLVRRPLEMSLSDKKLRNIVGHGANTCAHSLKQMVETENSLQIKELMLL